MIDERIVCSRGCGFPVPGGCYVESIGSEEGVLPDIVVFEDPIPYPDAFHRGWINIDLDALIAGAGVQRTGKSLARLEDTKLRQTADHLLGETFGANVVVRPGHALTLIEQIAHVFTANGILPGEPASAEQMKGVLQANLQDLLLHIDFK
jgi:hypothetical protein